MFVNNAQIKWLIEQFIDISNNNLKNKGNIFENFHFYGKKTIIDF